MGVRKHGRVGELVSWGGATLELQCVSGRPRVTTPTLTPPLTQPLGRHQHGTRLLGGGQGASGAGGAAGVLAVLAQGAAGRQASLGSWQVLLMRCSAALYYRNDQACGCMNI